MLDGVRSHPSLKSRMVLKGGTALNLFVLDVPRLSVDIDFNTLMLQSASGLEREAFGLARARARHLRPYSPSPILT